MISLVGGVVQTSGGGGGSVVVVDTLRWECRAGSGGAAMEEPPDSPHGAHHRFFAIRGTIARNPKEQSEEAEEQRSPCCCHRLSVSQSHTSKHKGRQRKTVTIMSLKTTSLTIILQKTVLTK